MSRVTLLRTVFAVLAVAMLAYAAHNVLGLWGHDANGFFTDWVYMAIEAAALAVCAARAIRVRHERTAWVLISLYLGFWFAGDLVWTVWLGDLDEPPYPSVADALYYASYLSLYGGVVMLLRSRLRPFRPSLWLNGVIVGSSAAAIGAATLFEPIVKATKGDLTTVAITLSYPIFDLLIVMFVGLAFGLTAWRPGRSWWLLGAGMICTGVADSLFTYQGAAGTYDETGWVPLFWPAAFCLIAASAWQPTARRRVDEEDWRGSLVPLGFAVAALGLIAYGALAHISPVAVWLAVLSLATGMVLGALQRHVILRLLRNSRIEATIDALSGLPNRRTLLRDLEEVAASRGPARLVFFDLDGFKAYNDSFGHAAGDALLRRLGERLRAAVTDSGRAYRLGGDEFCALLRDRSDAGVERAAAALSESGAEFRIGSSYGSVMMPDEVPSPEQALQLADARMYEHKRRGRPSSRLQTRNVLMQVLSEREPELLTHIGGVTQLSVEVGLEMGLDAEDADVLVRAAELHDIGKVAIPDAILHKPGPLDDVEWDLMRQHTIVGERIVAVAPALRPVAKLVRASHERWDGKGYPDGVAGEEIPLGARIVAVCDTYDAMTTDRSYRDAASHDEALAELRRCAATQFDPVVVDAFARVVARERALQDA